MAVVSLGLFDITISFGIGLFSYLSNHKTDGYKKLSNGNALVMVKSVL